MSRGLPFRLLRLDSYRCHSCHRDILFRHGRQVPSLCRWCGKVVIDWPGLSASVGVFAAAMGTSFRRTAEATSSVFNAFATAMVSSPVPYSVVVEYSTHDGLRAHDLALGSSVVEVLARDPDEATLVAAQMVSARGLIPTSTRLVIPEPEVVPAPVEEPNPLDSAMRLRQL